MCCNIKQLAYATFEYNKTLVKWGCSRLLKHTSYIGHQLFEIELDNAAR